MTRSGGWRRRTTIAVNSEPEPRKRRLEVAITCYHSPLWRRIGPALLSCHQTTTTVDVSDRQGCLSGLLTRLTAHAHESTHLHSLEAVLRGRKAIANRLLRKDRLHRQAKRPRQGLPPCSPVVLLTLHRTTASTFALFSDSRSGPSNRRGSGVIAVQSYTLSARTVGNSVFNPAALLRTPAYAEFLPGG